MSFLVNEAFGGNISPQAAAIVGLIKLSRAHEEEKLEIRVECYENETIFNEPQWSWDHS
jgi:hypothetical protein